MTRPPPPFGIVPDEARALSLACTQVGGCPELSLRHLGGHHSVRERAGAKPRECQKVP